MSFLESHKVVTDSLEAKDLLQTEMWKSIDLYCTSHSSTGLRHRLTLCQLQPCSQMVWDWRASRVTKQSNLLHIAVEEDSHPHPAEVLITESF